MLDGAFDIYQTDAGYAAVTNPVQRQILDALRRGDKQLPELVKITGRSKPTLSSLHMKELLARELIEEHGHPTDSRRKVYRIRAQKIGSSDIPVAQLRGAVQHYVSLSPLSARLPLRAMLEVLCGAPKATDPAVLRAQAARLGAAAAPFLRAGSSRDVWMRLSGLLEQEEIANPLRIDLEQNTMDLRPGAALATAPAWQAAILSGFVGGVAQAAGVSAARVSATVLPDGIRLQAR